MSEWRLSADTGGTFTDCLAEGIDGTMRRGKVLSSGRLRTKIVEIAGNCIRIESFRIPRLSWLEGKAVLIGGQPAGTVLQAKGDRLIIEDLPDALPRESLLEIDSGMEAPVLAMQLMVPELADGDRIHSFRLGTTKGTNALLEKKGAPVALFLTEGFKDLLVIRDQKRPQLFERHIKRDSPLYQQVYGISGRMDTSGNEIEPLNTVQLESMARSALARGAAVAAVCFLNSWANPEQEEQAGKILKQAGFQYVCLSSRVRPLIKYLDRSDTTLVNATLSPVMDAYLDQVEQGLHGNSLWIMTSAGGLVSRERFHAVDSLVSGPAGGVLGAVEAGLKAGLKKIIVLDMGGTSTDVSRWKDQLELRQQIQVGQARILTPAMPIETVAAGGGSICGFRDGRLFVGPESAGADPGPASYGAGGPLCLTDIHLLLGRIDPKGFSIPIRLDDARKRLEEVMQEAGESDWRAMAEGFLAIATERMAHAIRQVTLRDGEDPAEYGMVAFGGAGGLQACRVAEQLGIREIIYPTDAGILSARGIHFAPREAVRERQIFLEAKALGSELEDAFGELHEQAMGQLKGDGVGSESMKEPLCSVYMRIAGQETGVPVQWQPGGSLEEAFREIFVATFGYFPKNPVLEIVKLRLRLLENVDPGNRELFTGDPVSGPHIISDPFGTCFVEPGWEAVAGDRGSYQVRMKRTGSVESGILLENVRKTLVMNRLEGLVEEMGDQLQRTALSTNIRERLDFSCALLDREGRLLVNAPHIPVHLGAMGLCVRECTQQFPLDPGDVIITNHPAYGGSHLPDVTLMTGLFDSTGNRIGYLANRAHHAEWGGRSPGSMPADATSLIEEGVILDPQYLIRKGKDRFGEIEERLAARPYPSRAIRENRIDLEAQLAALQRGRSLFDGLLRDYGTEVVSRYFGEFYHAAADAMDSVLGQSRERSGKSIENLDDGHAIHVSVESSKGRLVIDFSGTSPVHPGNLNATPAIVRSAVLYVLRLLVDLPMPLNEGLLENVDIRLPECFLNPEFPKNSSRCPAVVGGNVETSQRVVDALIRALDLMAGSQGTMNNLLFGNENFGYYETIGGGAGAGDGFPGASATHVHMTNTAITDPEILEQRFPVQCREFSIRKRSGGKGKFPGGDGLVRELKFMVPVSLSLLSQHRKAGGNGLHGGEHGLPGVQWIVRADGKREPINGIAQVNLSAGEGIRVETPGGGGWGAV